jgi:hypothetical protein
MPKEPIRRNREEFQPVEIVRAAYIPNVRPQDSKNTQPAKSIQ